MGFFRSNKTSKVVPATSQADPTSSSRASPLQVTSTSQRASEQDELAASSVPLHVLCSSCRDFARDWDVLTHLQSSAVTPVSTWPDSRLCSVEHILRGNISCHLCLFILANIRHSTKINVENKKAFSIYLQPSTKDGRVHHIAAVIAANIQETAKNPGFALYTLGTLGSHDVGGFNSHITTTHVPLLAKDNLKVAQQWLQACLSNHSNCHAFHRSTVTDIRQRPTRVLEVTPTSVRLQCNMASQSFDYLVLSHMWGKVDQLKLTTSTLNSFQIDVPSNYLSLIYKEAVRVTRAMGYRYLWIDSLCIVQDSTEDWEYEASRMAIVYGNAICNLAYLYPSDFDVSQVQQREDPRSWTPCILRLGQGGGDKTVYIEHNFDIWRSRLPSSNPVMRHVLQSKWPLFKRAWTFQEYLLSPRTLFLGHQNLMFQCSRGFYDELVGLFADPLPSTDITIITPKFGRDKRDMQKTRYFPASIQAVRREAGSPTSPAAMSFMIDWQNLLNEYRNRDLTFGKDRIIAFAGIARAFANFGDMTYLAGAWREVLPLSLLWHVDTKPPTTIVYEGYVPGSDPQVQVKEEVYDSAGMPSWSPFFLPIYANHQMTFILDAWEICARGKSAGASETLVFDDIFCAQTHAFHFPGHDANTFPNGTSGFHSFKNLSLTLTLPCTPTYSFRPRKLVTHIQSDPIAADTWINLVFDYFPDVPNPPGVELDPPKHSVLALLCETQICQTMNKYRVRRMLSGLILVRSERRKGAWERVGAWKLAVKVCEVHVDVENIRRVADMWKGVEVLGKKWDTLTLTLV